MSPQPDSVIEPAREPQLYAVGSLLVALFGVVVLALGSTAFPPSVVLGLGFGGAAVALGALHLRRALSVTGGERAQSPSEERTVDEGRVAADRDPIAVLKGRYAAGEIDDAEFERRLGRLLELDTDASEQARTGRRERGRQGEARTRER